MSIRDAIKRYDLGEYEEIAFNLIIQETSFKLGRRYAATHKICIYMRKIIKQRKES